MPQARHGARMAGADASKRQATALVCSCNLTPRPCPERLMLRRGAQIQDRWGHLETPDSQCAAYIGARARRPKAEARSSGTLTLWLPLGRALHILTITVHHGPGVSDRCFLGSAEAANALHAAGALVLDLRQEGSHLALGRIDALIARLSSCHDLAGRAANNCTISQQSQYFHSSVSR
jgi:hypothetical protein